MAIDYTIPGDPSHALTTTAPLAIEVEGRVWPTVEHDYQAQRSAGTRTEQPIARAVAWRHAYYVGHSVRTLRRDWHAARELAMYEALVAKFVKHPPARTLLLATGVEPLVDRYPMAIDVDSVTRRAGVASAYGASTHSEARPAAGVRSRLGAWWRRCASGASRDRGAGFVTLVAEAPLPPPGGTTS